MSAHHGLIRHFPASAPPSASGYTPHDTSDATNSDIGDIGQCWLLMQSAGVQVLPALTLTAPTCNRLLNSDEDDALLQALLMQAIAELAQIHIARSPSPWPLLAMRFSDGSPAILGLGLDLNTPITSPAHGQIALSLLLNLTKLLDLDIPAPPSPPSSISAYNDALQNLLGFLNPDLRARLQDPHTQYWTAIKAAALSGKAPIHLQALADIEISDPLDGAGLLRTHDPRSGDPWLNGHFFPSRPPLDITSPNVPPPVYLTGDASLESHNPALVHALTADAQRLVHALRDALEARFVILCGHAWWLDARPMPRLPAASIQIAVSLAEDGLISRADALNRTSQSSINASAHAQSIIETSESTRVTEACALNNLLSWADQTRRLQVFATIDSPHDVPLLLSRGADGVGLCRTERLLSSPTRRTALQALLLSDPNTPPEITSKLSAEVAAALSKDVLSIVLALGDKPLILRLFDPTIDDLSPRDDAELEALASHLHCTPNALDARLQHLRLANQMLGHRGCRLGINHPHLYEIQARAIFEATTQARALSQQEIPAPWLLLPLISLVEEVARLRSIIERAASDAALLSADGSPPRFRLGAMLETPRACLIAEQIAPLVDFFSFGTSDLTQLMFGISRADASDVLPTYREHALLASDPFATLDIEGVGQIIRLAVQAARQAKPSIVIGICGDHASDPSSIAFFESLGLDHITCPPPDLLTARHAAATAALRFPS